MGTTGTRIDVLLSLVDDLNGSRPALREFRSRCNQFLFRDEYLEDCRRFVLTTPASLVDSRISRSVYPRSSNLKFHGSKRTKQMRKGHEEIVEYLSKFSLTCRFVESMAPAAFCRGGVCRLDGFREESHRPIRTFRRRVVSSLDPQVVLARAR